MSVAERILAVLGESPLSVPTPDLVALCGPAKNPRSQVWVQLKKLRDAGLITSVVGPDKGRTGSPILRWTLKEK